MNLKGFRVRCEGPFWNKPFKGKPLIKPTWVLSSWKPSKKLSNSSSALSMRSAYSPTIQIMAARASGSSRESRFSHRVAITLSYLNGDRKQYFKQSYFQYGNKMQYQRLLLQIKFHILPLRFLFVPTILSLSSHPQKWSCAKAFKWPHSWLWWDSLIRVLSEDVLDDNNGLLYHIVDLGLDEV